MIILTLRLGKLYHRFTTKPTSEFRGDLYLLAQLIRSGLKARWTQQWMQDVLLWACSKPSLHHWIVNNSGSEKIKKELWDPCAYEKILDLGVCLESKLTKPKPRRDLWVVHRSYMATSHPGNLFHRYPRLMTYFWLPEMVSSKMVALW